MGHLSIVLPPHQPGIVLLENGLEVLLKSDRAAPMVSLQVWVRTGSMHEAPWLGAGLSHLLEHMLFNGTESRDGQTITREIQAAGAYINAYTTFDRTVYWIECPPDSVATCLEILADMVLHSVLPEPEFNKELDVIRREMAMGDDSPSSLCTKLMFATTFQEHPCRHPVIGYRDVFDLLTYPDLQQFYRAQYVPNNMFVVAAGNFDPAKLRKRIEAAFGNAKRGPRSPNWLPPEPRQQGMRMQHREAKSQHSHLRIAWHGPGAMDDDAGALDLISTILGSGRSSRLYREVRERQALVHSIGCYLYSLSDIGLFVIAAETEPDQRLATEQAARREVERLLDEGVSETEFRKALHMSLAEALDDLTTTRGIAGDIGSSWLHSGHPEFTRHYLEILQELTPDSLLQVARRYITPRNCSIVSINPKSAATGSLKTARRRKAPPVKRIELTNGLTVLLKTDPRLPLISILGSFRGGLLAETPQTSGLTRLYARLLTRDTASRTTDEISEEIESLGGDFNSFSGYNSFGLSAEVLAPYWESGFEIFSQGLLGPAFREASVRREIDVQRASVRSERDRPMTTALKMMRESLFAGHPYQYPPNGTEETLASLTPAHLAAFHAENVVGGNGVIAVYGDIDERVVMQRIEQSLLAIPAGPRHFTDPAPVPVLKASQRLEAVHEKEQAVVIVSFPTGGIGDPHTLSLELISEACSDMSSPLYTRIREQLGAAYSVGTQRMLGFTGGCFFFYAATSREKADAVEEAMYEEIARLARTGLEADELERVRKSWHGDHLNRLQNAASLARTHVLDELLDHGWDYSNQSPALVDAITQTQTQEVAEQVFGDKPNIFVRLLPA